MDIKFDPGSDIIEQYEHVVNLGERNIKHEEENERSKTDYIKSITHTRATTNNSEIVSNYYTTLDGHPRVSETYLNLQTVNEYTRISNSNKHTYKNVKSEPADFNSETYISDDNIPNINADIEPTEQYVNFGCTDEIKSDHADVDIKRKHADDDFTIERVEHSETLVKGEMDIGPVELLPTDFAVTMRHVKEEPAVHHGNNGAVNPSNGRPSSQDRSPLREINTINGDIKRKKHEKTSKKKGVSFKCRLCSAKVTSLAFFNNHRKRHILEHATEKQECIECHTVIESVVELKSHYSNFHPDIKFTIFICDVCSKSFPLKQSLALHCRSKHMNIQRKKIEVQTSKSSRKEKNHTDIQLKSYYNNVHREKKIMKFICDICSKSFSRKAHLSYHISAKHTNVQRKKKKVQASKTSLKERNEKYTCSSCPTQFKSKNNHVRHYKMYHTEARFIRYTCDVCGQAYQQKCNLKDHIINKHVTPKPRLSCPHCAKVFTDHIYMKRHVDRVHLGRKNKECKDCGKRFISQTNFAKHVLMCQNEIQINKESLMSLKACTTEMVGKWICEICKKSYKNRQSKMDHIRRYHKDSKKLCNVCGLSLSCQSALKKHLIRAHSGPRRRKRQRRLQETLTPREFKCDICLYTYDTKVNLRAHITRYHPVGPNVNCDLCHKTFKRKSYLNDHKRTVHKDLLPYSCDRCSMTFRRKDKVTSHVKECFKS